MPGEISLAEISLLGGRHDAAADAAAGRSFMPALILLLLLLTLLLMLSVCLCLSDDEEDDAHLGRICGMGVVACK